MSDVASTAKGTLASAAYHRLRQEIITAEIPPGSKLKIRNLCDRFEVGLSPIREALSRLATEGLVRQFDQRGFTVAPLTESDLVELTMARCWLNETGLRQSIEKGGAQWEEQIVLSFYRLSRAKRLINDDPADRSAEWSVAHMEFHQALISASGSRWLTNICAELFEAAERYRHVARRYGRSRNATNEHKQLMEAAINRRADEAVEVMKRHFWKTTEMGRKALSELKE